MGCSKAISKTLLFVFNIIFFLLGAAVLAVGIFLVVDDNAIVSVFGHLDKLNIDSSAYLDTVLDAKNTLESCAYVLIAAGAIVFIIGFAGCCGAIKESKCLLYFYAIMVLVIFIAEIVAGVLVFLYSDEIELKLQGYMNDTLKEKYAGVSFSGDSIAAESTDPFSVAWDLAMVSFSCCGANDYTDFKGLPASNWPGQYNVTVSGVTVAVNVTVPVTCCKMVDKSLFPLQLSQISFVNVTDCLTTASSYSTNQEGCYTTIKNTLMNYSTIAIGVGIGIACLELIGIIAAFCLVKQIGKDDD